jgi:hypothetical protein
VAKTIEMTQTLNKIIVGINMTTLDEIIPVRFGREKVMINAFTDNMMFALLSAIELKSI